MRRVATAAAAALCAMAAAPAAGQSITIGDAVRLTPIARLHADVRPGRGGDSDEGSGSDLDLDVARRRVGVAGRVTSRIEFEVEREIDTNGGWRDAFADVRVHRALQVRTGHFKVPFSREQLTGAGALDFVYRSRAAALIAPGRSAGVEVHGRTAGRAIAYAAGGFVSDGTPGELPGPAGREPTLAGRITVRPWESARQRSLKDVEIGVAVTGTELGEGRESLRGRLTTKDVFFTPVFVSGRRLRVGGDLSWRPGPLELRAELLRADDARQNQGLMGESLPPVRAQGWYVSGVWAVAGRQAHARANDRLAITGPAGLELAVRVEQVSFGTPGAAAGAVWTPRGEQLSAAGEHAWTLGANWTANRFLRVQANLVRESISNRARGALSPSATWSPVLRVQVGM